MVRIVFNIGQRSEKVTRNVLMPPQGNSTIVSNYPHK